MRQEIRGCALLCALALLLSFGGCAPSPGSFGARLTADGRLLMDGPSARMTEADVVQARADEVPLLYYFAVEAGEPVAFPVTDIVAQQQALSTVRNWGRVAQVGEGYVDTQCQKFVAALDSLERSKRATLAGLNALQSATVGIMGLAQAAQKAIGIVGVSFGLGAGLFDITVSSVLYQLPAASVASVVQAQRDVLRSGEAAGLAAVDSQGAAVARLNEYILYCAPVTIEANIGKLLSNARGANTRDIMADTTRAAVTSSFVSGSGLSHSDASAALRAFADAPGLSETERAQRQRAIRDAAQQEGLGDVVVASFIRDDSPNGEAAAAQVAKRLGLVP